MQRIDHVKPKRALMFYFLVVLAAMTWVTVRASMHRGVWDAAIDLAKDPWFLATLFDAYFGFLTFYAWVFYKERALSARIAWLLAILLLGNFAMASYALWQLARLKPGRPVSDILLRDAA